MKSQNPKFSIVLVLDKREYFIRTFRFIQNLYFNDLEIILINNNPLNKKNKIMLENEK